MPFRKVSDVASGKVIAAGAKRQSACERENQEELNTDRTGFRNKRDDGSRQRQFCPILTRVLTLAVK